MAAVHAVNALAVAAAKGKNFNETNKKQS